MELTNEFRVDVPIAEAWDVLTDVERIAPCMPGAELQEVAGEEYRGIVKVKVGPITAQYKGAAHFVEKDDAGHKAVLKAEGRDTRGQGNANATITATLVPDGSGTSVTVVTDLTVTGKVAQFGRGVLADVSSKLLGQFVDCLHNDLLAGDHEEGATGASPTSETPQSTSASSASSASSAGGAGNGATAGGSSTKTATTAPRNGQTSGSTTARAEAGPGGSTAEVRKIESKPAQPVDLLDAAGVPVAKRAIPIVAGILVILWFLRRRRRNR